MYFFSVSVVSVQLRFCFRSASGPLRFCFGSASVPLRVHFGFILVPFQFYFGYVSVPFCFRFGSVSVPPLFLFGSISIPFWGRFGSGSDPLRFNFCSKTEQPTERTGEALRTPFSQQGIAFTGTLHPTNKFRPKQCTVLCTVTPEASDDPGHLDPVLL